MTREELYREIEEELEFFPNAGHIMGIIDRYIGETIGKHRNTQTKYQRRNVSLGLCRQCPSPVWAKGRQVCEKHRLYQKEYQRDYRRGITRGYFKLTRDYKMKLKTNKHMKQRSGGEAS